MTKEIGFPISKKENERRRVLTPQSLRDNYEMAQHFWVETNYGSVIGYDDNEYLSAGCHVCTRADVLSKDVICDPKIGDAEYLNSLSRGQTIFGWVHATQSKNITDIILKRGLRAVAWEKMFIDGRHVFYKNNELAGKSAVLHAVLSYGQLPINKKCAVIGNGNTARGAIEALSMLGAEITQYTRKLEALFRKELCNFDIVINCVLWDLKRSDHLIFKSDLKNMKRHSLIIDVSCDKNGAIETSIPTTINTPIYYVDGIAHYVVDHTPSLLYRDFTNQTAADLIPYLSSLVYETTNSVITDATIIDNGQILDDEIINYQHR